MRIDDDDYLADLYSIDVSSYDIYLYSVSKVRNSNLRWMIDKIKRQ